MYLPRSLISILYVHLQRTHHPLSPPVIVLVALEPDALCGCRILTRLLRRDYIPHKIKPIAGYGDLQKAGNDVIKPMMKCHGGNGGVVICLGAGGLVNLGSLLGLEDQEEEENYSGVEVWVIDARRPWNLSNVFGGVPNMPQQNAECQLTDQEHPGVEGGRIKQGFKPTNGGIIVFDDGDIEEDLSSERDSFLAIMRMPEIDDAGIDNEESSDEESESENDDKRDQTEYKVGQKRKFCSDTNEGEESNDENSRSRQRRRSNSSNHLHELFNRPKEHNLAPHQDPLADRNLSVSTSPSSAQPPAPPSARVLRRRFLRIRRKHELVLQKYYSLGSSYSEPISSMMYSLASELGREDNDLLWMAIVGVTSMEIYGRSSMGVAIATEKPFTSKGWLGSRGFRIRQLLRDEVRRLNPPDLSESSIGANRSSLAENIDVIPTTARNPTDTSIRLSPEPKFLLIRHWSLYDSMLHSPYLSARLHIWSENGRRRLHKLLAKMGVSLVQCKQSYTYMDMELKRGLRNKLLKYSEMYGLDDLVPANDIDGKDKGTKEGWGFVRSWGWRGTFSAQDVGVVIGAILEVGKKLITSFNDEGNDRNDESKKLVDLDGTIESEEWVGRFWDAYDALEKVEELKAGLQTAQHLHRAILRTGTSLIEKRQIRHLRAFRMCIVKEGPDVALFTHPAALTKLALWVGEAIAQQEKEFKGKLGYGGRGTPLVIASLNESRGIYVIVGTGGGGGSCAGLRDQQAIKEKKERLEAKARAKDQDRRNKELIRNQRKEARRLALGDETDQENETEIDSSTSSSEESESEQEDIKNNYMKGFGRNKFGNAFQEVIEETNARIRIDSFEHCVVEVKKEDLAAFLESLSLRAVIG
ncbi:Cell division control protein 45-like protein [Golovinomyces cichoracearum]|uniref:Cell division control protein 45-like protein n=1 Tax=Golovinomyces cichoracearum TaxID=62708 RepID=A0A420H7H2_9PEZI|nr:Cell division control protein 45-like protein [Golovinomyces cichoracearum]